jgi:hypothetical protein
MKKFCAVLCLYVGMSLLACQDTRDDLKSSPPDITYYKSVGEQIPFETGMAWMEFYKKKNGQQAGRLGLFTYQVPDEQLQAMLQSVSGLTGVAFHYGLDGLGGTHVIVIPVDESLSLWSAIPGRIYVDANTGNEIPQSVASLWAENYKDEHPNGIWFHYFGANIFDEILAIPYFNTLDIEPAINILNLTPQLLLIVWNEELSLLGRTADQGATVYDASSGCPPCDVQ